MIGERKQLWFVVEALTVCVLFGALWSMGGSDDFWGGQKWIRRFLGPFLFSIWAFIRSGFDWRYLVQMPFMMGAATLPYGADTLGAKWLLRGVFGSANGVAVSITDFMRKRFSVVILVILVNIIVSIGAGVYNQFSNAMAEQALIGFMIVVFPALSLRNKKEICNAP